MRLKKRRYQQGGNVSQLRVLPQATDIGFQPVTGVLPIDPNDYIRAYQSQLNAQIVEARLAEAQRMEQQRTEAQQRLTMNMLANAADPVFGINLYTKEQEEAYDKILSQNGLTKGQIPSSNNIDEALEGVEKLKRVAFSPEFKTLVGETKAFEGLLKTAETAYNKDPSKFNIKDFNTSVEAYREGIPLEDGKVPTLQDLSPGRFIVQPTFEDKLFDSVVKDNKQLDKLLTDAAQAGVDISDEETLKDFYFAQRKERQESDELFNLLNNSYMARLYGNTTPSAQEDIIDAIANDVNVNDPAAVKEYVRNKKAAEGDAGFFTADPVINSIIAPLTKDQQNKAIEWVKELGLDPSLPSSWETARRRVLLGDNATGENTAATIEKQIKDTYGGGEEELIARELNKHGVDVLNDVTVRSVMERAKEDGVQVFELEEIYNSLPSLTVPEERVNSLGLSMFQGGLMGTSNIKIKSGVQTDQLSDGTLQMINAIPPEFQGIVITDAFRTPERNAKTPESSPNSFHLTGDAIDVRTKTDLAGGIEGRAFAEWTKTADGKAWLTTNGYEAAWHDKGKDNEHLHLEPIGSAPTPPISTDPILNKYGLPE